MSSRVGPSRALSPTRTFSGISTYGESSGISSFYEGAGAGDDAPRHRRPPPVLTVDTRLIARVHFDELARYLLHCIAYESPNARSSARQRLTRLTSQQFQELSTDVYDELMRRKMPENAPPNTDMPRFLVSHFRPALARAVPVPFLPARGDFHPKRNRARQQLAALQVSLFQDLASDVYYELARRHPDFRKAPNEKLYSPGSGSGSASGDLWTPTFDRDVRAPQLRPGSPPSGPGVSERRRVSEHPLDSRPRSADLEDLYDGIEDAHPAHDSSSPARAASDASHGRRRASSLTDTNAANDIASRAARSPSPTRNDSESRRSTSRPPQVNSAESSRWPSQDLPLGGYSGEVAGTTAEASLPSAFSRKTAVIGLLLGVLLEELQRSFSDGSGGSIQAASDILDQALLVAAPSHHAYGPGIRQLRRWCTRYNLLPASYVPISSRHIRLESERPKFATQNSDVFRGVFAGISVAVKSLRLHTSDNAPLNTVQRAFHSEAITWKHLRHRNIVPFLGICDMSPVCFVSEWMEEGTLLGFLERHPGEPRTGYILGIVRGLQFMHFLKVVHGDIKAINVLVDGDRNARLADFGLVSALSNASIATSHFTSGGARGTARWMAPELFTDSESPRSDVSDIYALTITVWEIFTLQTPFSHIKNDYAVLFRAQHGERPPKPEGCEAIGFIDELWEVMQQGWATEPQSRQPLSAFADLLQRL